MTFYERTVARFSRRQLLKICAVGAAALAPPLRVRRLLAKPVFDAYPFSMGVASGDPLPDGIVLWTRLAPKPLDGGGMPMNIVDVDWEIAKDARVQNVVQHATALARPELGHSVHVEVAGLEPGREYWYRFHAGDAQRRRGLHAGRLSQSLCVVQERPRSDCGARLGALGRHLGRSRGRQ